MTVYGARSFFGHGPQNYDCLETDKEVVVTDLHPELEIMRLFGRRRTKSIRVNLGEEGEKSQPIFTSASMPVDLKRALLIKETQKRFCMDLC